MNANQIRLFGTAQDVRITQPFGSTAGTDYPVPGVSFHNGVDYAGPGGKPLACLAVDDGEVTENSYTAARGNFVTIFFFAQKRSGRYLHFDAPRTDLPVGKRVAAGDFIGYSGQSGDYVTGNHLHFGFFSGKPGAERYEDYEKYTFAEALQEPVAASQAETIEDVYAHALGEQVTFSSCYKSSSNAANARDYILAKDMIRDTGTITRRLKTAGVSTYLLDDGLCWINDGDIRGGVAPAATATAAAPASDVGRSWTPNSLPLNLYASASSPIPLNPSRAQRTYTILDEKNGRIQIQNENFDIRDHKVWVNLTDGTVS